MVKAVLAKRRMDTQGADPAARTASTSSGDARSLPSAPSAVGWFYSLVGGGGGGGASETQAGAGSTATTTATAAADGGVAPSTDVGHAATGSATGPAGDASAAANPTAAATVPDPTSPGGLAAVTPAPGGAQSPAAGKVGLAAATPPGPGAPDAFPLGQPSEFRRTDAGLSGTVIAAVITLAAIAAAMLDEVRDLTIVEVWHALRMLWVRLLGAQLYWTQCLEFLFGVAVVDIANYAIRRMLLRMVFLAELSDSLLDDMIVRLAIVLFPAPHSRKQARAQLQQAVRDCGLDLNLDALEEGMSDEEDGDSHGHGDHSDHSSHDSDHSSDGGDAGVRTQDSHGGGASVDATGPASALGVSRGAPTDGSDTQAMRRTLSTRSSYSAYGSDGEGSGSGSDTSSRSSTGSSSSSYSSSYLHDPSPVASEAARKSGDRATSAPSGAQTSKEAGSGGKGADTAPTGDGGAERKHHHRHHRGSHHHSGHAGHGHHRHRHHHHHHHHRPRVRAMGENPMARAFRERMASRQSPAEIAAGKPAPAPIELRSIFFAKAVDVATMPASRSEAVALRIANLALGMCLGLFMSFGVESASAALGAVGADGATGAGAGVGAMGGGDASAAGVGAAADAATLAESAVRQLTLSDLMDPARVAEVAAQLPPLHVSGTLLGAVAAIAFTMRLALPLDFASTTLVGDFVMIGSLTASSSHRSLANLVSFVRIVLWTVVTLVVLRQFSVDISSALQGMGFLGVAVAFAMQSTLQDAINTLWLYLDRPFKVGDFVDVGKGHMGTVISVNMRNTELKLSNSGQVAIIPNSELAKSRIENFATLWHRRVAHTFTVAPTATADQLDEVPGMVKRVVLSLPNTEFQVAALKDLVRRLCAVTGVCGMFVRCPGGVACVCCLICGLTVRARSPLRVCVRCVALGFAPQTPQGFVFELMWFIDGTKDDERNARHLVNVGILRGLEKLATGLARVPAVVSMSGQ